MSCKSLDVVAGCICRENRFLLCRRPLNKARGGQWEFPGGKVEPGETMAQALIRELSEELNIIVYASELLAAVEYSYPDVTVKLKLLRAELSSGQMQLLEHLDAKWVSLSEAAGLDLCPADRLLLRELERSQTYGFGE